MGCVHVQQTREALCFVVAALGCWVLCRATHLRPLRFFPRRPTFWGSNLDGFIEVAEQKAIEALQVEILS